MLAAGYNCIMSSFTAKLQSRPGVPKDSGAMLQNVALEREYVYRNVRKISDTTVATSLRRDFCFSIRPW